MTEATPDTAPAPVDTAPVGDVQATQAPIDTQTPTEPPVEARAPISEGTDTPSFALPDEHKEKPWADKVKSQDDLYKQIDNLSELIGKKTITPIDYSTATSEEIAAHHSSLAPENVADYEFGDNSDPAFSDAVGSVFQKYGIDKYQAKGLSADINNIAAEIAGAKKSEDTSADGYMKMMKDSFGDDYEKTVGSVEVLLRDSVTSDGDKQSLDSMDNGTRAVVDRTVHSISQQYEARIDAILKEHGVTESGAQTGGDRGANTGVDVADIRSGLRNKMTEISKRNHTAQEMQDLKSKLDATYR